ncbi:hypothetical protein MUN84_09140 [Hymenobacter sp. 5516J-16]|uniref:hypothetical protein n=1 Tax=Hymenobacter sp. 5516J-16 TaxID=2932253 RepID=UPI001FCFBA03|nr:hypothetical protein [Hymenobacter sp. 5516J-16]UOQ78674.1 hypothetical protein MUN84_09140 [Hymenobacter sp. 5516J-16]
MILVRSLDFDNVIKSKFVTAEADYNFAISSLVPLINRLDIQREVQDAKFYQRLEKDLVKGCIMPPITIAFINNNIIDIDNLNIISEYISRNIKDGFILDGIQRLNTLQRTYKKYTTEFDLSRKIYINVLICSSMDNLLYRMITLNNGQKPMSARHQIEILTANVFDFADSEIPIITEKVLRQQKIRIRFNKSDFIKGYLAFLANSTNIENQKIIEDKLDQLIAEKILTSDITDDNMEFSHIVSYINFITKEEEIFRWFKNVNNLIGFCVGIRKSFNEMNFLTTDNFKDSILLFEEAFSNFNFSKIKVGRIRRNLVSYYIANYSNLKNFDVLNLVDTLSQVD